MEGPGNVSSGQQEARGSIDAVNSDEGSQEDSDGDDYLLRRQDEFVRYDEGASARRRDSSLGFVDQVSAGIGSYLARLAEKESFVVYNRSVGQEAMRWQQCLKKLYAKYKKKDASEELSSNVRLDRPCHGRPECPKLGPCTPPPTDEIEFDNFPLSGDHRLKSCRTLSFSSSFESGNLALAQCNSETQYNLLVDFDVNTGGYTQWFYFAVRGGVKGMKVNFRLVNMAKSGSLFGEGMCPVIWSEQSRRGWERGCTDVAYEANNSNKWSAPQKQRSDYHTLSFNYTFEFDDDTVFFAYHYPYTYSYLQHFLDSLAAHPYAGKLFSRSVLCTTIGGLPCDALEVNSSNEADGLTGQEHGDVRRRKFAVVTSRVHPGESNASWMMHGFIQFLLSPAAEAKALRQAATWLIVPMLNPDGVVNGSYRCSLAGTDLNRTYNKPHKLLHPEVYNLKETMKSRAVNLFIDLHGHSKKEGVFFYGGKAPFDDKERNAHIKLLPRLCCLASEDFKWSKCSFNVHNSKLATARLVAFLELNVDYAYTVEASFHSNGKAQADAAQKQNEDDREDVHEGSDESGEFLEEDIYKRHISEEERAKAAALALLQPAVGVTPASSSSFRKRNTKQKLTSHKQLSELREKYGTNEKNDSDSFDSDEQEEEEDSSVSLPKSPVRRRVRPSVEVQNLRQALEDAGLYDTGAEAKERKPLPETKPLPMTYKNVAPLGMDFSPERLELVGPTIGRAVLAAWQVDEVLPACHPDSDAPELLTGAEAAHWPHLHYDRMTGDVAKWELAKLISGKMDQESGDDEGGSDSNPSADEKPRAELRRLQKRLMARLKKRKTFKLEEAQPPEEPEEEVKYKIVVAFGKSMKVPLKPQEEKLTGFAGNSASSTRRNSVAGTTAFSKVVTAAMASGRRSSLPSNVANANSSMHELPEQVTSDFFSRKITEGEDEEDLSSRSGSEKGGAPPVASGAHASVSKRKGSAGVGACDFAEKGSSGSGRVFMGLGAAENADVQLQEDRELAQAEHNIIFSRRTTPTEKANLELAALPTTTLTIAHRELDGLQGPWKATPRSARVAHANADLMDSSQKAPTLTGAAGRLSQSSEASNAQAALPNLLTQTANGGACLDEEVPQALSFQDWMELSHRAAPPPPNAGGGVTVRRVQRRAPSPATGTLEDDNLSTSGASSRRQSAFAPGSLSDRPISANTAACASKENASRRSCSENRRVTTSRERAPVQQPSGARGLQARPGTANPGLQPKKAACVQVQFGTAPQVVQKTKLGRIGAPPANSQQQKRASPTQLQLCRALCFVARVFSAVPRSSASGYSANLGSRAILSSSPQDAGDS
eukprot:TRINITY_DN32366_c0_g1_i1.p1 TRINITY_DN32366_c0_g1~~TRINITY_DN32366_c0_g1_i1.p1  ORF type:complete len:1335 (+),score=285.54 TRINITY_DN32366_c0_g1_i1:164-4168(+)